MRHHLSDDSGDSPIARVLERVAGYVNGFNSVTEIGNGVTKSGNEGCAIGFSRQGIENSQIGVNSESKSETELSVGSGSIARLDSTSMAKSPALPLFF